MDFRILGPLEVVGDDGSIEIRGHKERLILALLLTNARRVVSVDTLVEELWGDEAPPTAVPSLRSHMSRLRRQLRPGSEIETIRPGYLLRVSADSIDAGRFEVKTATGLAYQAAGAYDRASAELASALSEWRGNALAGLDNHDFARDEANRLELRRQEALEVRISMDLELGRHHHVIAELEHLVNEHPFREVLWRMLMLALYRSGRQTDALGAFKRASTTLGEEFGIEPSETLRSLEERILLQEPDLIVPTEPAGPIHNLPASRDSFVGRENELEEIAELLDSFRIVTLTGVGGSGKTRLGIEAARAVLDSHEDGAKWVELATITDAESLAEHVLLAFGEPGSHSNDPAGLLVDLLRARRLLLVLDNCEHLIDSVATLTDRLVGQCPHVTVLATSRQSMAIAGEAVFQVPTLGVPSIADSVEALRDTESVALLVARIRAHTRDFDVDHHTSKSVVTVCRQLDGIPLAIELAAARLRTLSIDELAERIDERFDLLTRSSRTAPPRQQTLRATIEWSYELLTPEAQKALRETAIFAGSWTIGQAEAITSGSSSIEAGPELIDELLDKSLLERVAPDRFRLLETIRQFAFEQLVLSGDAAALGRRHRDLFLETARSRDAELRGHLQVEAWASLEKDLDNLRAAINWSLDNDDVNGACELVAALGYFWMVRGYWREAWRWLERVIVAPRVSDVARARAVTGEAITEVIRVNFGAIDELLREAIAVFKREKTGHNERIHAESLYAVGRGLAAAPDAAELLRASYEIAVIGEDSWTAAFAARYLGSEIESKDLLEESFERFMSLGDRWNAAFSMYFISSRHLAFEEYEEGEAAARRARGLANEVGDSIWYAHATRNLGLAALYRSDHEHAKEYMTEALDRLSAIGDDACSMTLNRGLSSLALESGDHNEAVKFITEAIRSAIRLQAPVNSGITLWKVAEISAGVDDLEMAVRFSLVANRELSKIDTILGTRVEKELASIQQQIATAMDSEARLAIEESAGCLSLTDALEEALVWCLEGGSAV